MGTDIIVPLGAFACAIVCAIGVPLARAYSRRVDSETSNPHIPTEITTQLERIERSIDSVAVEIERISEGQRFTTTLLSEGKSAYDSRQSASTGMPARNSAQ